MVEIRPVVLETDDARLVEHWSGDMRVGGSTEAAPDGVQLKLPGAHWAPVRFGASTEHQGAVELEGRKSARSRLHWPLRRQTPSLVQRTLEVPADAAQW